MTSPGREREQKLLALVCTERIGLWGKGGAVVLLGLPVGPPFGPCTMMYEMYVQTEMFIQPIKMEFPYLSAWPGHRSPFQYIGLGTGLRWGQPRAACSLGPGDQCEARDGAACAPWTWL